MNTLYERVKELQEKENRLKAEVLQYFGVEPCEYSPDNPWRAYGDLRLVECVSFEVEQNELHFYVKCDTGEALANSNPYLRRIGHAVYERGGQTMAIGYDDDNHADNIYLFKRIER